MSVLVFHLICSISVLFFPSKALASCASLCPRQLFQQSNRRFERKSDRFWEFSEEAGRWIEVQLPYDLEQASGEAWGDGNNNHDDDNNVGQAYEVLPQRKRLSLTKLSDSSVWMTGESGSIYERFWNGLQWVIAPHEFPIQAGRAIAVFVINQTILALSEAGILYQVSRITFQNFDFLFFCFSFFKLDQGLHARSSSSTEKFSTSGGLVLAVYLLTVFLCGVFILQFMHA